MRKLAVISLLLISFQWAQAQLKSWSFNDLDSLQGVEQRDIMIFMKAEWCKFCKVMENKVFQEKEVSDMLNESFWVVIFDGESNEQVRFRGKTYSFLPTGNNTGVHEFAVYLADSSGKVSYPTLAVISPEEGIIFRYHSFLNKRQMLELGKHLTTQ